MKIVDKYTLKVWSDTYQRYVPYCHFTTLERVQKQIELYRQDCHSKFNGGRWHIWKGCKPIDIDKVSYKIIHERFEVTERKVLEEEVYEKERLDRR